MMKNLLFRIMILAVMTHIGLAYAEAKQVKIDNTVEPITGLINDWSQFRHGIIAHTSQFNKLCTINPAQLPTLPQALTGKWTMISKRDDSGYHIHAALELKKDHQFVYDYQIMAGDSRQDWAFSGRWQEKNQILVLSIKKSSYPGEDQGDILFWRLLQIDHSHLMYVRSVADQMQTMRRVTRMHNS